MPGGRVLKMQKQVKSFVKSLIFLLGVMPKSDDLNIWVTTQGLTIRGFNSFQVEIKHIDGYLTFFNLVKQVGMQKLSQFDL